MTWARLDDGILANPIPLKYLPERMRAEIEILAAAPIPPPKWKFLGHPNDPQPMAAIPSRAYYEWHLRRGRDIRRPPEREGISAQLRMLVLQRDGMVCQLCNTDIVGALHIDHVRPVARGGVTTLGNLQVTHAACNIRKGARWPG